MKSKKILIVCLFIIIFAGIITNIYILSNREKNNTNEFIDEDISTIENQDVLKDVMIGNLKITNGSLLIRDGISTYQAVVTNNTQNDIKINKLYVEFSNDTTSEKILALSNANIKANESTNIKIVTETDLTKVTKIKYIEE